MSGLQDDIRCVFSNAKLYNKPETPFHRAAQRVSVQAEPVLAKLDVWNSAESQVAHALSMALLTQGRVEALFDLRQALDLPEESQLPEDMQLGDMEQADAVEPRESVSRRPKNKRQRINEHKAEVERRARAEREAREKARREAEEAAKRAEEERIRIEQEQAAQQAQEAERIREEKRQQQKEAAKRHKEAAKEKKRINDEKKKVTNEKRKEARRVQREEREAAEKAGVAFPQQHQPNKRLAPSLPQRAPTRHSKKGACLLFLFTKLVSSLGENRKSHRAQRSSARWHRRWRTQ